MISSFYNLYHIASTFRLKINVYIIDKYNMISLIMGKKHDIAETTTYVPCKR